MSARQGRRVDTTQENEEHPASTTTQEETPYTDTEGELMVKDVLQNVFMVPRKILMILIRYNLHVLQ